MPGPPGKDGAPGEGGNITDIAIVRNQHSIDVLINME